jgi:hypothetical protein
MWAQVRKFSPIMILVAFVLVYLPKGFGQLLTDIQNLTIDRLQAKWQNIAMAIGAGIVMVLLKKVNMPPAIKAVIMLVLYFVIGYNVAKVIDPPGSGYGSYGRYVPNNPYRNKPNGG